MRFLFLVLGGLVLFRGSTSVGAAKVLYGLIAAASFAVSLSRLSKFPDGTKSVYRRLTVTCITLSLFLVFTLVVALGGGAAASDWVRDVLPYLILVAAPVIGLDAGQVFSTKTMNRIVVGVGIFSTVSFTLQVGSARSAGGTGTHLGLASNALCYGFFAYALAQAASGIRGPARALWIATSIAVPAAMLSSGTRGSLIVFFGFLGALGSSKKRRISLGPGLAALTFVALVGGATLSLFATIIFNNPNYVQERVSSAFAVVQDSEARQQDQSYLDRQRQYTLANDEFAHHPILGSGPGHLYPAANSRGVGSFALDAPTAIPAKFGLVGCAMLLIFFARISLTIKAVRRTDGFSTLSTMARSFALIFVAYIPLGSFFEDKGLALVLMIFFALLGAQHRDAVQESRTPPANGSGPPHVPNTLRQSSLS